MLLKSADILPSLHPRTSDCAGNDELPRSFPTTSEVLQLSEMLQQPDTAVKRHNCLNELTMQSRLMTEDENRIGKKSEWFRLNLTGPVKNFSRTLCQLTYITTLVIKNNNLERLPAELGNLTNLVNLDASCNKLQSLPATIGDLIELRALILNDNKIVDLPFEIGRLLNLRHFNLNDNPLSTQVSQLYGDGSDGQIRSMIRYYLDYYCACNFNTAPPQRQWRKLDELSKDGFPFTLMCYNLLSPNYATPNQYPYCPSWALNWDYRRRSILDEIRIYHANIICLQEVETNQFEEIFKPELEKLKYDAVFLPKSRRRTMDTKDGKKVDGCAIFWQTDKFEKLHEFHHEFMISCSNVCEKPTPLILDRVMTRDNVALGVIFETKGSTGADGTGGRQFCVTTGHIHWDPEHSDVKMIQTILWTAELWAYIDQFLTGSVESLDRSSPTNSRSTPLSTRLPVPGPSSPAANMPVILCGDLNSLPESGVVEFLMRGSLPKTHNDFLNNGFKYMFEDWRLLEKWAVDGDTLRHRFAFDRAYRESQGMKLTNFTYEFKGMIDYVLYTRQHFRLLGSLDQIHESWFAERKIVGCPHVHFPSDHFALLVELELKPTPQVSGLVAARRSARNRSHSETASDPGQSKPNASAGSSPSSLAGGSTPYNRTRAESVGLESSGGGADGGGSGSADGVTGFAVVHSGSSNNKQRKR
ncbi:CCR4-NOT transcription complex subunit 6 [Clonorchis sinensis]|uniref:CCR4-NOT transcription complex subunit 6 n=2 Tax=Clonorchis sinensis TaxID=79923 RepID=G7YTT4_CLOSI|nr:CCR4-NOT transcription complex subunit 6 [Clonorchis sinensis]